MAFKSLINDWVIDVWSLCKKHDRMEGRRGGDQLGFGVLIPTLQMTKLQIHFHVDSSQLPPLSNPPNQPVFPLPSCLQHTSVPATWVYKSDRRNYSVIPAVSYRPTCWPTYLDYSLTTSGSTLPVPTCHTCCSYRPTCWPTYLDYSPTTSGYNTVWRLTWSSLGPSLTSWSQWNFARKDRGQFSYLQMEASMVEDPCWSRWWQEESEMFRQLKVASKNETNRRFDASQNQFLPCRLSTTSWLDLFVTNFNEKIHVENIKYHRLTWWFPRACTWCL